jgi:type II secretory pathway component PulF
MSVNLQLPSIFQTAGDLTYTFLPILFIFLGVILAFVVLAGIKRLLAG